MDVIPIRPPTMPKKKIKWVQLLVSFAISLLLLVFIGFAVCIFAALIQAFGPGMAILVVIVLALTALIYRELDEH